MKMSKSRSPMPIGKTGLYALLIILLVIFLAPLLWLILSSLKTQQEMVTFPPKFLPDVFQFVNYLQAVTKIDYLHFLLNTLELCLIYTLPGMLAASIFAYAFARFQVPGKNFLFGVVLVVLMIPPISVLLPEYVFFAKLRLVGTYKIWLLWGIGANPLYIYLLKQFFSYFPRELEEAAIIDGCGRIRILFRIFIPLSKPALVTVFILSFLWVYGDFMGPVIFLSGDNTTLPVAMANGYVIRNGILLVPALLSGIVLYIIPVILIFAFGQKYYIRGLLSSSGMKG
ncbi:MAG: carbohydrate ABC transporter permease [Spirochaetales bacterium]|nr:MAG: carbohydrate ABC transporter permease [Spirochaetales bacterium]